MENNLSFLSKLKIGLPYDWATPLLGIYPKEIKSYERDTNMPIFIVALLTIAKTWDMPRPSPMGK
jgi:hypothetical protein